MWAGVLGRRFLPPARVGGILPIACGLAYAGERVWCFVGDMCASVGAFNDALRFAHGYNLDLHFVIEDNGLSTNTPTLTSWKYGVAKKMPINYYRYERTYPHYQPLPGQHGF